jgi:serine phosphatase RsbU (regulator of sigma subunit)
MNHDPHESRAFQRATLKSESYRVVGLLCLLAAFFLFALARGLVNAQYGLLVAQTLVLLVVIAHELDLWRSIRRALRDDRDVAPEKWVLNVFIESQIPTIALFLLMLSGWFTPYQVLVAPAVLAYFLLIILSTLRLSPSLTLLTGILSTIGYLLITFYTGMSFPNQPDAFPMSVYYIYAGLILAGGVVATIVAGQIKIHVAAALREATLQSQLEQVNHDLDLARSIQQGLLPTQSPKLDEFEIAGWNQPADQTGGDYFDWQSLPDGRIAISLGDATGHGIGPALVSALCRAYARASFLVDQKHDGVLERLNSLLSEDLSTNRFVTFAVIFLQPANSEVRVLSAGHGPILFYRHDTGKLTNLEAQGIPLGMIAGISYAESDATRLGEGDIIVLVTDGFYEWENPQGEEFGTARLEETILQARHESAEDIIERLRSAVKDFCKGTPQKDDLTVVVLKRKTARAAASIDAEAAAREMVVAMA